MPDARAVDSRIGEISKLGGILDKAIRAKFRNAKFKLTVLRFLLNGCNTSSREWSKYKGRLARAIRRTMAQGPVRKGLGEGLRRSLGLTLAIGFEGTIRSGPEVLDKEPEVSP